MISKTHEYFNFMFLLTTGLRKFAYRSGFITMVQQCPYFTGRAPESTAKNRLTYLKSQKGWLATKRVPQRKNVYYLSEKGLRELGAILNAPSDYYTANPELGKWITQVGLNAAQLPDNAFNPGKRDFGLHEQLCDRFTTDWTAVIGRPVEFTATGAEPLVGAIDFVWCFTEPSIAVDMPGHQYISPDVLMFLNCTVSNVRVTKVAVIEVEATTLDYVSKAQTYIRWFWTDGFGRYYREQRARFPLSEKPNPVFILGFIFPDEAGERRARDELVALRGPRDEIGLSMIRTSHAGLDFAADGWKSVASETRRLLFY